MIPQRLDAAEPFSIWSQRKFPIVGLLVGIACFCACFNASAQLKRSKNGEEADMDRVLRGYKSGLTLLRQGDFEGARTNLDYATSHLTLAYAGSKDAKQARSTFRKESSKLFLGEPYEKVMAYYYRGFLYWKDGEPDNARACFRSAQFVDSDTEHKEYQADYVLLDYLDALTTARLKGDPAEAFHRSRTNSSNRFNPPPEINPAWDVFVFIEFGTGPTKYASGAHKEELRITPGKARVQSVKLTAGGQSFVVRPYDDLSLQATTRGPRVMDHILANKAVFKDASGTIGDVAIATTAIAAHKGNNEAALASLGIALTAKVLSAAAKPQADTRCWDNLPQYLSFAAFQKQANAQTLDVEFLDDNGQPVPELKRTFQLPNATDGKDILLFVSDATN